MDDIIKKLSDIEDGACKILEDANKQKNELSEHILQITRNWDLEKEEETRMRLEEIRSKIRSAIDEKLRIQEQRFQDEQHARKLDYENHKEAYLDSLFRRITEV